MQDELEARKNAGHQDIKAALPTEAFGTIADMKTWDHIRLLKYVAGDETPAVPVFMSTDSAVRKLMPVATGCLNYFPDALLLVAWVSRAGNDKHNPGQPLHWAKEKSTDQADCEVRHMLDYFRGEAPDPGLEPLGDLGHLASKAWRALAHLQVACDEKRKAHGGK